MAKRSLRNLILASRETRTYHSHFIRAAMYAEMRRLGIHC